MPGEFAHKVALVTGAASGIGRWVAQELAREGATVVALDRDRVGLDALVEECTRQGGAMQALTGDLRRVDALAGVADEAHALHGRIDILVNSAGVSQLVPWTDITIADWDRIHDVNLKGLFFLTQAVAMHMRAARSGRIVNIASVGGKRGGALTMHYGASKAGVINLTRSLAQVLAADNITVNAVCPGYVETALTEMNAKAAESLGWAPGERQKQLLRAIPLGRLPELAEVGSAVLYLASERGGYITGQSLNVDGGVVND